MKVNLDLFGRVVEYGCMVELFGKAGQKRKRKDSEDGEAEAEGRSSPLIPCQMYERYERYMN